MDRKRFILALIGILLGFKKQIQSFFTKKGGIIPEDSLKTDNQLLG